MNQDNKSKLRAVLDKIAVRITKGFGHHFSGKILPPSDLDEFFTDEQITSTIRYVSINDSNPEKQIMFCRSKKVADSDEVAEKNQGKEIYYCYFDETKKETFLHGKTVLFFCETEGIELNKITQILKDYGFFFNQEEFDRAKSKRVC